MLSLYIFLRKGAKKNMASKWAQKGKRGEREIVRILREEGIDAKRVPLSGSTDFQKGDVVFSVEGYRMIAEVKFWAKRFSWLYKMLEGRDILFCRGDREEWLVVMRLDDWLKLKDSLVEAGRQQAKDPLYW